MKKLFLISCCLFFSYASELIVYNNLDEAKIFAIKENKPIALYVYSSNCHWCKRMEQFVFSEEEIKKELNEHYIFVKLNKDIDKIPQELIPRFVPTTYILNKNQEEHFAIYGYKKSTQVLEYLKELRLEF